MKRLLSLLLALCMILGVMPGMAFVASAEEVTKVTNVSITLPEMTDTLLTAEDVTVSGGVVVESLHWDEYQGDGNWEYCEEGAPYNAKAVYKLDINLLAAEGYTVGTDWDEECAGATINGKDAFCGFTGYWDEDAGAPIPTGLHVEHVVYGSEVQLITEVRVDVPNKEVGASMTDVSVPEDAPYSITEYVWYDSYGNELSEPLGTFEESKKYFLNVELVPDAGYWFAEGEGTKVNSNVDSFGAYSYGSFLSVDWVYNFQPTIDRVELTVPTELGETLSADTITVPEDANYTVELSELSYIYGDSVESCTIGYGFYTIELDLYPADGYTFDMDESDISLNGGGLYDSGWEIFSYVHEDHIFLSLRRHIEPPYGFTHEIEMTGLPEKITAGKDIAEVTEAYVNWVDNGNAQVTVTGTQWVNENYEPVTGTFENGKVYYLAVTVQTNPDAPLYADVWIYHNAGYSVCVNTEDGITATAYIRYSLMPSVDTIEVFVEEPVIGNAPGVPTVPEDAPYEISGYSWEAYYSTGDVTAFEDGEKYRLIVDIVPAEGYEFAAGAVVYINGEKNNGVWQTDYAYGVYNYSFLTPIVSAEITVEEPVIGGTPGVPTVPEDAPYYIEFIGWYDTDTYENVTAFEDGHQYMLNVDLYAKEGYEFTGDTVFTTNGQRIAVDLGTSWAYTYTHYSFAPVITEISVGLPSEMGDVLSAETIILPEDANYSLDVSIYHNGWQESCIIGYGVYNVELRFYPNEGYTFDLSEDNIFINGAFFWDCGWEVGGFDYDENYIFIDLYYYNEPENGYVYMVHLGGLPEDITAGAAISDVSDVVVDYIDNDYGTVTVTDVQWVDEYGEPVTGTFESGKVYYLAVSLRADPEVPFESEIWVVDVDSREGDWANSPDGTTATAYFRYSLMEVIESVEVTFTEPVIGAAPVAPTVPEDAPYYINEWYINDPYADENDTTYEDGHRYTLYMEILPNEGYEFAEGAPIYLNGELVEKVWEAEYAVVYMVYSFMDPIDAVEITVEEPAVGGKPGVPTVDEDAPYEISDYYWEQIYVTDNPSTFEDGYKYRLTVDVAPKEGYEFTNDTVYTINGVEANYWGGGGFAEVSELYSFLDVIDRVDITAPELKPGDTFNPEDVTVTTPGCTLESIRLEDAYSYDLVEGALGIGAYDLWFEITAKEGYEFSEELEVYVNGEKLESFWSGEQYLSGWIAYDFREEIDSVVLSNLPTISVGDTIEEMVELTAPNDANYTAAGMWGMIEDYELIQAEGQFENGNCYYFVVQIEASEGYKFSEDVTVTIDGEAYQVMYHDGSLLMLIKMYNLGMQVIDTVEITVTEPVAGQTPGKITVAEGAGYTLMEGMWGVSDVNDVYETEAMGENDKFQYGNYYWLVALLVADEGYVFAEDVVVKINGKVTNVDGDVFRGMLIPGMMAAGVHNFGLLKEPVHVGDAALGDINADGEIDLLDANLAVAYYNETADLTEEQLARADVDGNGEVDLLDANMIVGYYNETVEDFPIA